MEDDGTRSGRAEASPPARKALGSRGDESEELDSRRGRRVDRARAARHARRRRDGAADAADHHRAADSGVLGTISDFFGTSSPQTLIPIVAGIVAGLFILKSVCALLFRWWILGRTTRISALASSKLMRLYILAPYADHRARRTSEIYRSVSDSTAQSTSVLLAVTALFTDGLVLVALAAVIAVVSPTVMVVTAVIFGVLVFGVQRALRNAAVAHRRGGLRFRASVVAVPSSGARRVPRGAAHVERERVRGRVPGGEAAHGSRRASAGDRLAMRRGTCSRSASSLRSSASPRCCRPRPRRPWH